MKKRIKHKMRWFLMLTCVFSIVCGLVACTDNNGSSSNPDNSSSSTDNIDFDNLQWGNPVEELNVTVEQAAAVDFSKYYTLAIAGETQTVSVDTSAFVDPIAGESYIVKYAYGEKKAELTVNVYGLPTITVSEETKTTLNLTWENRKQLTNGIMAKDSFGAELSVSTKLVNVDENSEKAYGTFIATYTVTDKAGNKQTLTRSVVIAQKQFAPISAKTTDLSHPECLVDTIADMTPLSGAIGGVTLRENDWVIGNGYFMLTAQAIARAGVGEHMVAVEFDGAETSFTLTVTDKEAPKYTLDERGFDVTIFAGEEFVLPETVKDRYSYQDIEVSYKLNDNGIDNLTVQPKKGKNQYVVSYSRNNEVIKEDTYTFIGVERLQAAVDAATYAAGYEMEWTVSANLDFVNLGDVTPENPLNPASGDLSYYIYFDAADKADMKSGYSFVSRSNSQFSIGGGVTIAQETTVDNLNKFLGGSIFDSSGKVNMWSPFLFNPNGSSRFTSSYTDTNGKLLFKLRAVSNGETTTVSLYLKHKLGEFWDMLFEIQGFDQIQDVTYAGISYGGEQGSIYVNDFSVKELGAAPKTRDISTAALVTDASKKVEMTYTLSAVDDTFVNGGWNYIFYNEDNVSQLESTGKTFISDYIGLNGKMKTKTNDAYTPTWSGATWVADNVANDNATATLTADEYVVNKGFENAVGTFDTEPLKSYVIDGKIKFKWTFENVTEGGTTTLKVTCSFMNTDGEYVDTIIVTGLAPMVDNTYVGLFCQDMGCYEKSYIKDFAVAIS